MQDAEHPSELTSDDREELRLLYQVSVSDIAYFKQQQWSVTNYALTLQATVVVIAYQVLKPPFTLWQLWFLVFMTCALSAAAIMAIKHLHASIVARRARLNKVRTKFGRAFNDAWAVETMHDQFRWILLVALLMSAFVSSWLLFARA